MAHLDEMISIAQAWGSSRFYKNISSTEKIRDLFLQAYNGQSPEAQIV